MNDTPDNSEKINLKNIERKISLLYFQDGMWDMVMGFTLVAFGIGSSVYDYLPSPFNSLIGPFLWLLGFIAFFICKRIVTFPRLGIIKPRQPESQKKKVVILVGISAFLVVLTVAAVILTILGILTFSGLGYGTAILFGLIPLTLFSGIAILLKYYRILIHGALFGIAEFMNELFNIHNLDLYGGITLIACGCIMIVMGIFLLLQFLQKYPVVNGADMND